MKSQPPPWQYDGMWGVYDAQGRCVADHEMYEYKEPPPECEDTEAWDAEQREIEVNTLRLVAAAPDLLELAKDLRAHLRLLYHIVEDELSPRNRTRTEQAIERIDALLARIAEAR